MSSLMTLLLRIPSALKLAIQGVSKESGFLFMPKSVLLFGSYLKTLWSLVDSIFFDKTSAWLRPCCSSQTKSALQFVFILCKGFAACVIQTPPSSAYLL